MGAKLFECLIICIRYSVVNCDFVVLVSTFEMYCLSVHPGRGIPPMWLFPRFHPSFFLHVTFFFSLSIWHVFSYSKRGQRMSFAVHFVRHTEAM